MFYGYEHICKFKHWQRGNTSLSSFVQSANFTLCFFLFLHLRSAHKVFILHVLPSCASSLCTPFSFMSLHLSFCLPMSRCPLISIFYVVITTSSSVFLSLWPNHRSLASQIFLTYFCHPLLFLQSFSFQASLFPSSISTFSSVFFLVNVVYVSGIDIQSHVIWVTLRK